MTIIWGTGGKSKNPGGLWVPYFCTSCDRVQSFSVTENYRYGQVYGIRIAKYKAKYFLVCHTCDRVYQVETKEGFIRAQEIARKIEAFGLETGNGLMGYVAEVARDVLNNQKLADAIESDIKKELE
jgi:hypothetical protein